MTIPVSKNIELIPIDKDNAARLFPLFRADLKEISRWFPFDESYQLEYDLAYVDEKEPPYDETFVIFYNGEPCGRIGLYDYNAEKREIYLYYWVASAYRRKHIALDSISAVLSYLKTLGIGTVLFDVKKENENSVALIRHFPGIVAAETGPAYVIYAYALL